MGKPKKNKTSARGRATTTPDGWEPARITRSYARRGFVFLRRPGKKAVFAGLAKLRHLGSARVGTPVLVRVDETRPKGPWAIEVRPAPVA